MKRLVILTVIVTACGGSDPAAPDPAADTSGAESPAPPPEAPRARVLARYGCEERGWTLTYAIDAHARSCDDGSTTAPLEIVQRPAVGEGPQRFAFTMGGDAGEGDVCRAPASCAEAEHTLTIFDGDPPRIEWSLSLSDEGIEHGSGAVLLCNEAPPAPCAL